MNRPSFITWRPATTRILIGGLVILLISLVVSYVISTFRPTTLVTAGSGTYRLWIADTDAELAQGLSDVPTLSLDGGLLMKFPHDDTWGIWMKDMKVPLDIIWLDENKKVVYIVKNALPELSTDVTFTPKDPARYVIELRAGAVENAAIKTGSFVVFDENDSGAYW